MEWDGGGCCEIWCTCLLLLGGMKQGRGWHDGCRLLQSGAAGACAFLRPLEFAIVVVVLGFVIAHMGGSCDRQHMCTRTLSTPGLPQRACCACGPLYMGRHVGRGWVARTLRRGVPHLAAVRAHGRALRNTCAWRRARKTVQAFRGRERVARSLTDSAVS
jgi:hypothetical protein